VEIPAPPLLILVVGLIITVLGGTGIRRNRAMTRTGQRVTGTVIDLRSHVESDGDGGTTRIYRAVLVFRTLDSQDVQAVVGMGSRIIARPGEQVPVIYDPGRPDRAEIDTPAGRATWFPVFYALVGLAILGYGVYRLATGAG